MKKEKNSQELRVNSTEHKCSKGITLIALVITIIVLLILAMVSVQIITNQGIIQHTENAANFYEQKQDNELEQLNLVEQELNQYATGSNTESNNNWWEITEEERSQMKILIIGSSTYLMVTSNNVG